MTSPPFIPTIRQARVNAFGESHAIDKVVHVRAASTQGRTATGDSVLVANWKWKNAWHSCEYASTNFARLTAYQLSNEVAEHSVRRELIVFVGAQREELHDIRAELNFHRQLLAQLFAVIEVRPAAISGKISSASASRGVLRVLENRLEHFVREVEEVHEPFDVKSAVGQINELARTTLGDSARLESAWKRHREDQSVELVVEVHYPRDTSKQVVREFLRRYSESMPEDVQQRITLLRIPSE